MKCSDTDKEAEAREESRCGLCGFPREDRPDCVRGAHSLAHAGTLPEPRLHGHGNTQTGVELIAAERRRQIEIEGWTPEHDDEHRNSAMAWAAVCYAAPELIYRRNEPANVVQFYDPWPWEGRWDKRPRHGNVLRPNNGMYVSRDERIRQLQKAGALLAAEIDRLQRAASPPAGRKQEE